MIEKVYGFIKENNLLSENDNIVLGVSGGVDSVCLLYILKTLSQSCKLNLLALHVNHGIREHASKDAEFSRNLCEKLGVDFILKETDCPKVAKECGISVEEAGRNERYRFFNEAGKEKFGESNFKIAVAHHMDDMAETMIFNMARGTGINGIVSIKPQNGNIIRPLLVVSKDEIEDYLSDNSIEHILDETNLSDDYARNKIRHKIIPVLNEISPKATAHLAFEASVLGEIDDYLNLKADEIWEKCVSESENILIKNELSSEHPAIRKKIIQKALIKCAGRARDIGSHQIDAVDNLLFLQTGKKRDLIYNMEARREYDGIVLNIKNDEGSREREEKLKRLTFEVKDIDLSQNIPTDLYTKWFDYDKIENCPSVRFRNDGDYLTINEHDSKKLLSDYMINEKIPLNERDEIPLLADGNHILWVVGYRISNRYKISDKTRRILVAKYEI